MANEWTADELSLSTLGWNVSVVEMDSPKRRGDHLQVPMRSGVTPRHNRSVEPAEFTLSMWVLGCNSDGTIPATGSLRRQTFDTNLHNIVRVLCQDSRPILFKRATPFGDNRVASALLTDSIGLETMMGRQRGEFKASFLVVDGFWRDEATKTAASGPIGITLPKVVTLTNLGGGTAPIDDAAATVTGPIVNPRITCMETGAWVQYGGSLALGETWVADSASFTSKKNGASVLAQTTHGGHPRLLYIPARCGQTGVPQVTLSGTGSTTATTLSVTGYRKWMLP